MNKQVSPVHSYIGPRKVRPFEGFNATDWRDLTRIGIDLGGERAVMDMAEGVGMDALTPSITTGSIPAAIQFLQTWLPGFVNIVTAPRKIDDLLGIATTGAWDDEEIVQGVMEQLGTAVPYSDYGNVPLSSWNINFNLRTVVRFEEGMRVGKLEEARSSRMQVNTAQQKREAATLALEIQRNVVGFYGYNGGDNQTYGFFNDPGLPNYTNFANGASASPLWSTKTFQEIIKDIRVMFATLRTQSQGMIDPKKDQTTLAMAIAMVDYLSVTSDYGVSVADWLEKTYPACRVESAPELNAANGGANVAYLYAETMRDGSSDGGRVWLQAVPVKFRVLGVETKAKGYEEDYTNATAGVMLKRPYAIVRYSGG